MLFIYYSIYIGLLASVMFEAIVGPNYALVINFWFSKINY